jgi:D-alanine--D-alanine ligase
MHKLRVGVLRGGPSPEYDVSLKTGQTVLTALPKDTYDVKDIFIDKQGKWHLRGLGVSNTRALDQVDVVFNALHGTYGEDGTIQRYLDTHGMPYTGSPALGSAIAMNKALAKDNLGEAPCKCARHKVFNAMLVEDDIRELFHSFNIPMFVKPLTGGSSIATTRATSYEELKRAIATALSESDYIIIEEAIRGREATVAVVEHFRDEELYGFPPIEIVYEKDRFFDYRNKYEIETRELCPAPFERGVTEALIESAKHVHKMLGLRDYSRSDFMVTRNAIYFLEVNTLPGLTPTSLVPKAVEAVGATLPQFLEHLVLRAYTRK